MEPRVTSQVLEELRAAAASAFPKEACGILLGEGAKITAFLEATNVHHAPETHFEIDPQALINAYRAEREGGPQVLGYFHSHPKGPAAPSATDQKMAAGDGKIWAISGSGEIQFWRDAKHGFEPLSYIVIDT
jgi:proteasome lid subunit RPN8/RPN11